MFLGGEKPNFRDDEPNHGVCQDCVAKTCDDNGDIISNCGLGFLHQQATYKVKTKIVKSTETILGWCITSPIVIVTSHPP